MLIGIGCGIALLVGVAMIVGWRRRRAELVDEAWLDECCLCCGPDCGTDLGALDVDDDLLLNLLLDLEDPALASEDGQIRSAKDIPGGRFVAART